MLLCICVHLQHIHQSVLSPCFGSPRLSVKDITRCRIRHANATQQPVRLFFFLIHSHASPASLAKIYCAAGQTCWCLGSALKHTWCRVRSCFSGGHVYSLTSPEEITVLSSKRKKLGLRWQSHGIVVHFPCEAHTLREMLRYVHHAACCPNQRLWRRMPTVTVGANPRNQPSSSPAICLASSMWRHDTGI